MAQAVFGSPIKKFYGEAVSLTTTAAHLAFMPGYHEVSTYCSSAWRMGLAPRLAKVVYYNGTTYTDYTTYATDRVSTTHVPLDGMLTSHALYLGTTEPTRGFYFDIGTGAQAEAATLDVEYMYDVAKTGYWKITGTVSGALTVGETVTETNASDVATGTTATLVYSGATYIIVKNVSGSSPKLITGYDWDGAAQSCNNVTAVAEEPFWTGYFTDVASDADATTSGGAALAVDGLYAFTLPAGVRSALLNVSSEPLFWYRFYPSATLSNPTDIVEIIPAADATTYTYMEGGVVYQFALNPAQNGAFEFDHASTGTLDVNWIMH